MSALAALSILFCGCVGLLAAMGVIYGLMVAADTRDVPDANEDWL